LPLESGLQPLRAAGEGGGVIYVTTKGEYQRAKAVGEEPVAYMGFPVRDVTVSTSMVI
jgi:hypothetical protein